MKLAFFFLAGLALSGCSTTYQSKGFTDGFTEIQPEGYAGGFIEIQLDEHAYQVTFNGNGWYTERQEAAIFTLLRSAELAIEHGYQYFVIVDSDSYEDVLGYYNNPPRKVPGTATAFASTVRYNEAVRSREGGYANLVMPSRSNTIICFKEKPELAEMVYNARTARNNIASQYGIDRDA